MSKTVRLKNDAFRKAVFTRPQPNGKAIMTHAVASLAGMTKVLLFQEIVNFNNFTEGNDPYGEHDFGCVELEGLPKIYWKIDYYEDATMVYGTEDRLNAYRVLVIMFAEEY